MVIVFQHIIAIRFAKECITGNCASVRSECLPGFLKMVDRSPVLTFLKVAIPQIIMSGLYVRFSQRRRRTTTGRRILQQVPDGFIIFLVSEGYFSLPETG